MEKQKFNTGIGLTALGSFWWGVIGVIYFKYISFAGSIEVVIHRCVWTSVALIITTFYFSKWDIFFEIIKNKKNIKEINGTPERNLAAWKEYILPKLDQKRTFANTDGSPQAIDEFLDFAYNSLIKNQNQVVDGAGNSFGSRSLAERIGAKRVLHFNTSDDWFDYNAMFCGKNLKESLNQ